MSKRKLNDTDGLATASPERSGVPPSPLVALPRTWLLIVTAVVVAPWLISAGWQRWSESEPGGSSDTAGTPASAIGQPARWGQLEVQPIVIAPPLEYVPNTWGPVEAPEWRFPGATRPQVEQFLSSAGLEAAQVASVLATGREDPRIRGIVVSPDRGLVRSLPPQVRSDIYVAIGKSSLNQRQYASYRQLAPSVKDWLGASLISSRTLALVEPLAYRVGDFQYFADIDLIRSEIESPAELQRLAKGLLRTATVVVKLHVPDPSHLDELAEYWGRGGRRTDIRPLLESIAAGGPNASIDITHLLPTLAREHLYRFPRVTLKDLEKPTLVNCYWTALNFFEQEPNDRYLDQAAAYDKLKRDYFIVHDKFQFGDIAMFSDSRGETFHAAVYLADDLVFGKNGISSLSPWTIVPLEKLRGYYLEHADDWNVVYYRRKDL